MQPCSHPPLTAWVVIECDVINLLIDILVFFLFRDYQSMPLAAFHLKTVAIVFWNIFRVGIKYGSYHIFEHTVSFLPLNVTDLLRLFVGIRMECIMLWNRKMKKLLL